MSIKIFIAYWFFWFMCGIGAWATIPYKGSLVHEICVSLGTGLFFFCLFAGIYWLVCV